MRTTKGIKENGNIQRIKRHVFSRFASYVIGLLLFYVPAALFVRAFYGMQGQHLVGNLCDSLNLRMGVGGLLKLKTWESLFAADPRYMGIFIIIVVAFLLGPLFCGWLCAAGALSEGLSRLVPYRFKIDIQGKVNAAAIRYGFLAGFVLLPFFEVSAGCAYCNYRILNFITLGITEGFMPTLTSTYITVVVLWLIIGGIFMKGGRGWCIFLCPVGGIQNLFHCLGARFAFTLKLRYTAAKCKTCLNCVKVCPLRAISPAVEGIWQTSHGTGVLIDSHTCSACNDCVAACPHGALSYGRGKVMMPDHPTFTLPDKVTSTAEEGKGI